MNIAATVSREDWLRKAANNKDNNNSTVVYVESSLTNRLRAVSLFSWTVEQNVRDTQTTTRVTKGARLPPSFLAFRGFAAQRSGHQATGSLRKDQQRVGIPPTPLVRPHASLTMLLLTSRTHSKTKLPVQTPKSTAKGQTRVSVLSRCP